MLRVSAHMQLQVSLSENCMSRAGLAQQSVHALFSLPAQGVRQCPAQPISMTF